MIPSGLPPSKEALATLPETSSHWNGRVVTWTKDHFYQITVLFLVTAVSVCAGAFINPWVGVGIGLLALGSIVEAERDLAREREWLALIDTVCGGYEQYQQYPLLASLGDPSFIHEITGTSRPFIVRTEGSGHTIRGLRLVKVSHESLILKIRNKVDQSIFFVGISRDSCHPCILQRPIDPQEVDSLESSWNLSHEDTLQALRQIVVTKDHPKFELAELHGLAE